MKRLIPLILAFFGTQSFGVVIKESKSNTPIDFYTAPSGVVTKQASISSAGVFSTTGGVAGYGAKNYIINGNFDFWQRNNVFTDNVGGAANQVYKTADRWATYRASYTAGINAGWQVDPIPNSRYNLFFRRSTGNATGHEVDLDHELDRDDVRLLRGKVVTLSFWARRGSTDNGTANTLILLQTGTGAETTTYRAGTYTGHASAISSSSTLTTSWQKFTFTSVTLGSAITTAHLMFYYTPSGTSDANEYIAIAQVMLNEGSNAAPFQLAGGTIAGELALAQRYYEKNYDVNTVPGNASNPTATTNFTANIVGGFSFSVQKRAQPVVTIYSYAGTVGGLSSYTGGGDASTGCTAVGPMTTHVLRVDCTAGGLGAAGSGYAYNWTADAEL